MSTDQGQDRTSLGVQLDNLAVAIKKLANSLIRAESAYLVESQVVNRLVSIAARIEHLKSLEEDEGEVFASLLKGITDILQSIGDVSGGKQKQSAEERAKIIRLFKMLEQETISLLPLIRSLDEQRKERKFDTFGGLLQRMVDAIQEKRHMLMRKDDK